MSQAQTSTFEQLSSQYMTIWNEPDAEQRRQAIPQLWREDGVQFTPEHVYRGYQQLEERVTGAYEQFVAKDGCIFRLSKTEAHHDAVLLTWDMLPAHGGEILASGLIFLILADDGRIRLDYHF